MSLVMKWRINLIREYLWRHDYNQNEADVPLIKLDTVTKIVVYAQLRKCVKKEALYREKRDGNTLKKKICSSIKTNLWPAVPGKTR